VLGPYRHNAQSLPPRCDVPIVGARSAEFGNLSSAGALRDGGLLADGAAKPGDYSVLIAMGPGFCTLESY